MNSFNVVKFETPKFRHLFVFSTYLAGKNNGQQKQKLNRYFDY